MSNQKKELDDTLTQNTQSSTIYWDGGVGTFAAYGTFDGGTAKLQASFDGGTTFIDVGSATSFTSNGMGNFSLPAGTELVVDLSGATSPDLEVEIMEVHDIVLEE